MEGPGRGCLANDDVIWGGGRLMMTVADGGGSGGGKNGQKLADVKCNQKFSLKTYFIYTLLIISIHK